MKTLCYRVLTAFLCLLLHFNSFSQWQEREPGISNASRNALAVLPSGKIFVGGEDSLSISYDFGQTWQNYSFNISSNTPFISPLLWDVKFMNDNLAFGVVGDAFSRETIVKSVDGGLSWSVVMDSVFANGAIKSLRSIHFPTPLVGYCAGRPNRIYKTVDGGTNWSLVYNANSWQFNDVYFLNADTGFAVGNLPVYTHNGGLTWTTLNVINNGTAVEFLNNNVGYITSSQGVLYKVNAAGTFTQHVASDSTWLNGTSPFHDVHFINADTGYVTSTDRLLRTIDGGTNWEEKVFETGVLRRIAFTGRDSAAIMAATKRVYLSTTANAGYVPLTKIKLPITGSYCQNNTYTFSSTGHPSWSYSWTQNGNPISNQQTFNYTFTSTGSKVLRYIVNNGQAKDTTTVTITVLSNSTVQPFTAVARYNSLCAGSYTSTASVSPYPYIDTANNQITVSPVQAGVTYKLYKTDGTLVSNFLPYGTQYLNGSFMVIGTGGNSTCGFSADTAYVNINVFNRPVYDWPVSLNYYEVLEDTACFEDTVTIRIRNTNTQNRYRVRLSDALGNLNYTNFVQGTGADILFPYANAGLFLNKIDIGVTVIDINGCNYTVVRRDTLYKDTVVADFDLVYRNYLPGDTVQLVNTSNADFYTWSGSGNFSFQNVNNAQPLIIATTVSNNPLPLTLKAQTHFGCQASLTDQLYIRTPTDTSTLSTCYRAAVYTEGRDTAERTILDQHVGKDGSIYTAGYYFRMNTNAYYHYAISKTDPAGNFVWERKIGFSTDSIYTNNSASSTYRYSGATGITTDENDNIYVCGSYNNRRICLDTVCTALLGNSSYNTYVAKYNKDGRCLWIINSEYQVGSFYVGGNMFSDIEYTGEGRLIVAGLNQGRVVFKNGIRDFEGTVEIDTNGNFLKNYFLRATYNGYNSIYNITEQAKADKYPAWPKLQYHDGLVYVYSACTQINDSITSLTAPNQAYASMYVGSIKNQQWQGLTHLGTLGPQVIGQPTANRVIYADSSFFMLQRLTIDNNTLAPIDVYFGNTTMQTITDNNYFLSRYSTEGNLMWTKKIPLSAHIQQTYANGKLNLCTWFTDNFFGMPSNNGKWYSLHNALYPRRAVWPYGGLGGTGSVAMFQLDLDGNVLDVTDLGRSNNAGLISTDHCFKNVYISSNYLRKVGATELANNHPSISHIVKLTGADCNISCNPSPQVANTIATQTCSTAVAIDCSNNIQYQYGHVTPIRQTWALHGTATITADTRLQYTNTSGSAADTVYYTVCDLYNRCDTGIVAIQYNQLSSSFSATICNGNAYNYNNTPYTIAGNYSIQTTTAEGCDSTVSLYLSVDTVTAQAAANADTLYTINTNTSFSWIDCNTNAVVGTGATLVAPYNGSFAVVESNGQCADTSACIQVIKTGLFSFNNNSIQVYPNPSSGIVNLVLSALGSASYNVSLYNASGILVYKTDTNTQQLSLNLSMYTPGMYTMVIGSNTTNYVQKVVLTD